MSVELCLFEIGLEMKITSRTAVFHEIWLAESLKTAWFVWSSLGWDEKNENRLKTEDWASLDVNEELMPVIYRIEHILRVSKTTNFNIADNFTSAWRHIIVTINLIVEGRLFLETCSPVVLFRKLVAELLGHGVKEGLVNSDPLFIEHYLFTVRNCFVEIQQDLMEWKVTMTESDVGAIISVMNPDSENTFKCDRMTIIMN